MITKISSSEYLKRYDNMDAGERQMVNDRVGQWLRGGGRRLLAVADGLDARLQNVMQLSAGWNDADCQAFMEGVRLMTAFAGHADTWLPEMIYVKAAKRSIRKVYEVLFHAQGEMDVPKCTLNGTFVKTKDTGDVVEYQFVEKTQTPPLAPPLDGRGAAGAQTGAAGRDNGITRQRHNDTAQPTLNSQLSTLNSKGVPPRPRHIDQYVHLLPEATQKRAAVYGELMRELDLSREKLRIVAEDVHASDRDRQLWAVKVRDLDKEIGDIRKELDAEWEKVAAWGRVVVDELGMAHLIPDGKPSGTVAGGDLFGMKPETSVDDNQRKAALLRKWLIDTRYGNKDAEKRAKQQEKWKEKYLEMVRLGGMETVTEKVREAAKHYEIDIAELDGKTIEHSNTGDALDTNNHK